MNSNPRKPVLLLSKKQVDEQVIESEYKAGYAYFVVRSKFIGNMSIGELLFQIIENSHKKG